MAVETDMLWLGSVETLNLRSKAQYVVAQERVEREYRGTLEHAIEEFRYGLDRAHYAGVVYFCIDKRKDGWYAKGYPIKKK